MLRIFNSLTRKKEEFHPINLDKINLYVCGITVYDVCHLGHARTLIVFDAIVRYLNQYYGYRIQYVRNITDIDDKIIKRSIKNNETISHLTNRMIQKMHVDLDDLNILRPTYEPRITDNISIIIDYIQLLIKKRHAYVTSDGDVYFEINTAIDYGILSHKKNLMQLVFPGIHNENIIQKKNHADFVLWKSSKFQEPSWSSPWGKGRPGWHIECSAINHFFLGKQIDIHGGGSDLIFPHHENELAQSACAYNISPDSYSKIWMHVGMLLLNNEKMSKSLNNFFSIREMLQKYDSETIRYFLLSAHYRNQLQYSDNSLKNARMSLEHLYLTLRGIEPLMQTNVGKCFVLKFAEKMDDDFNIPAVYAILFEIAHEINSVKSKNYIRAQGLAARLKYLANILGILNQDPEIYLKNKCYFDSKKNFDFDSIQRLIKIREHARLFKQWELADKIRKKLNLMGIILEDNVNGKTTWRYYYFDK